MPALLSRWAFLFLVIAVTVRPVAAQDPGQPAGEKPAEKPSEKPAATATEKPVTEKPATEKPVAEKPAEKTEPAPKQPATAQEKPAEPPSADEAAREKRLAEIERVLRDLLKEVGSMRSPAKPATTTTTPPPKPQPITLPASWIKSLTWRAIGPANMGGRIVDLAVFDADPSLYWIATASGGLLKTTNNGITFEHQFDRQTTVSIGAVAVAPSDRNVVWVGTGENNPRNSVSYGDGVYKSTDGGKTWKNMGLEKTYQVGKIVIHPTDPNIVYVGALGRLYGPNEERGLYKTTDGGTTWNRVLFTDNRTGVIDMRMHPTDPETLLVAMWDRERDEYDSWLGEPVPEGYNGYDPARKWGPTAGIYKTSDGGKTFRKLTKGLPSNQYGRVGLDWYRKDPNVVYAIIDCEKIGMGTPPQRQPTSNLYAGLFGEDVEGGARITRLTDDGPADKAGLRVGDVLQAIGDKVVSSAEQISEIVRTFTVNEKVKFKVLRDDAVVEIEVTLEERPGGRGGPGGGGGAGGAGSNVFFGFVGEDTSDGLKLTRITEDSPAATAKLAIGDIVTHIDDKEVKSTRQVTEAVRGKLPGDVVPVKLRRGEEQLVLSVKLAERPGQVGSGGATRTRPWSANYSGQAENHQDQQGPDGHEYGGVYKSVDAGETWTRINSLNPRPMYFSQVRVDPQDDNFLYVLGVQLYRSQDGGKTFKPDGGRNVHADHHALWIDPRDGRHMLLGGDGGTYVTYDRMNQWDHLNHTAIGQFYHVAVSPRQPYYIYGGLQDNGSWGGPAYSLRGSGAINEDWISISGGDGFVCRVDLQDPDWIYFESQNGAMGRRNLKTGQRANIRPATVEGAPPYRFNWNTPFLLSHHNSKIFYAAGNYVFRSLDRGNNLEVISPEITLGKRGSATALAESPRSANVVWAGTDDGALWVTRNGGREWTNVTANLGLPKPRWIATIEPSRFADGRCYVCCDGHRSNDDDPYIFVTEDYGTTWKSLRANLPWGSTRCLREDRLVPDLLYLGTEFSCWASFDRGLSWNRLNNNLPTVAVHEFAQHPVTGDLIAGTHGRSLWVLDVTPLRQLTAANLDRQAALYRPTSAIRWQGEPARGKTNRRFVGQNPPEGAVIWYSLPEKANQASLKILDVGGDTIRELRISPDAGLHQVTWDLTRGARTTRPTAPSAEGTRGGRGGRGGEAGTRGAGEAGARGGGEPGTRGGGPGGRGANPSGATTPGGANPGNFTGAGRIVPSGSYRVVLTVDDKEYSQTVRVEPDPNVSTETLLSEEEYSDGWRTDHDELRRRRQEK